MGDTVRGIWGPVVCMVSDPVLPDYKTEAERPENGISNQEHRLLPEASVRPSQGRRKQNSLVRQCGVLISPDTCLQQM